MPLQNNANKSLEDFFLWEYFERLETIDQAYIRRQKGFSIRGRFSVSQVSRDD